MNALYFASLLCASGLTLAASATTQNASEPVDDTAIEILRRHGIDEGQVMDHLSWLCDVFGPRLTGTPNLRNAQDWAVRSMTDWGLSNAHVEEWGPFGRGWQLVHASASVTGENPWVVLAVPKAWSASLEGRVEAEIIAVGDLAADELDALDLSDKIVMVQPTRTVREPFDATAQRRSSDELLALADDRPMKRPAGAPVASDWRKGFQRRRAILRKVFAKNPIAILDRGSKGSYGTIFATSASLPAAPDTPRSERPSVRDVDAPRVIPQFTLAVEHYNRIARLLAKGMPVRMALELDVRYFDDDPMERNVIAEIPGIDPMIGDEVVMLGAHLDSWHSGTGATDNGCGSAVVLEAARILQQLVAERGQGPRRTIRIGLWAGEEQGLLGSRAYVAKHLAKPAGRGAPPAEIFDAHAKFAGYFNLDNGTGRIRGIYCQENAAVAPIFRAWLRPFHDLDATTITIGNTGGTDHLAFDRAGLPGFQFIQDQVSYFTSTHHSNMDNWDHAVADDLEQAATIMASFAWHTAQRDAMLPRKPIGG